MVAEDEFGRRGVSIKDEAAELLLTGSSCCYRSATLDGRCSHCQPPHAFTASVNGWLLFDSSSAISSIHPSLSLNFSASLLTSPYPSPLLSSVA
jgi:hypothetical protein